MKLEYTLEHKDFCWTVYSWDVYPAGSVLEGQERKQWVESYDSQEEALEAYPTAEVGYREVCNYVNHLPNRDGYCNTLYDEGEY